MNNSEVDNLVEGGEGHSYLTRCVAIVSLLHERGVLEELIESGRITAEEVDIRVNILEQHYPGFKTLAVENNEDKT